MTNIFVDADAFVALNAPNHPLYLKAKTIIDSFSQTPHQLFTCTYAILEAATVINMHIKKGLGPIIAQQITENPHIMVISGDEYLRNGIQKMSAQTSKNVSLNDCVNFCIADDLGIKHIFSFDKHWTKNGYTLLG
ncbi:hypothetical protein COY32_00420 [candidate division WWE3 bacterium CG_4_10_14_0_2_um_filter_41_14]|uniref:Uncharacterized protein n=1 Tax=candidate division WWE3 bacterium CG_4_10_14_0_2_um_filter_41_14 TaxID=1975072 RepID=A0A2M7TLV4_UNCKA|nr:MAG: hypothetical protein COY32_00420 [candidate division WWE3 bacterium CG_4_10_14_0_2_um_filter_41_14]